MTLQAHFIQTIRNMENINGNHETAFEDFVSENDPKISNKECLPSANEVAVRQCSHLCLSVYSQGERRREVTRDQYQ